LDIYLVDGTYELFRHYYALPSARDSQGREVAAVRGVLASVMGMIKGGATHIAVATDHVIESFRNGLWPDYKTSEGVEPDLLAQFPLIEEALSAAGVVVWPMVEFEADDALAAAAAAAAKDKRVEHVIICTPDKDLAQCVSGTRIVQLNRRTRVSLDEAGIVQKFGIAPASIPDYLALVGGRPSQVSPYRIHPAGLSRVACEGRQRDRSRRNSSSPARASTALPYPCDSAHRHIPLRQRGSIALERANPSLL
jgi:5'-3' exonuclease